MLILTRKVGEVIMIGKIQVIVTKITPEKVRIGIDAPLEVNIRRGELQEEIKEK